MSFTKPIWVIKIGGRLCEHPETRDAFARAVSLLPAHVVLVHGGGVLISQLQQTFGQQAQFFEGKRITSQDDLRIVEMALSGVVNKSLVRSLLKFNGNAVGISGCDAQLVTCSTVEHMGAVGQPKHCDVTLLHVLIHNNYIPVVSPVSLSEQRTPLNVNADDVACCIAQSLKAQRLILVSDVVAVLDAHRKPIHQMPIQSIETFIEQQIITGGMIPKIRSAQAAIESGVQEVVICGFDDTSIQLEQGTRIF